MSKLRDPERFSTHFSIDREALRKHGSFDPILNADTRLFIDPLLLRDSKHDEMRAGYAAWAKRFGDIIRLLEVARDPNDVPWRQARALFRFPEFKGTCLGYGSGSIHGSGVGPELTTRLLATAHRIIELGVRDPELFSLLSLLEDDIGPDRISDMASRIIAAELCDYTVRVLRKVDVPKSGFIIADRQFLLPVNPFARDRSEDLPVVLVPRDVLRALPIATDWSDVSRVAAENDALRKRLNARIGELWLEHRTKKERKKALLADGEAIAAVFAAIKKVPRDAYDIDRDPEGRVHWLEIGLAFAAASPAKLALSAPTLAGLKQVVEAIIAQFQHAIENQGLWKILYDMQTGKPLHEHVSQLIFHVVAESYCRANEVDISPETNQGGGPVDFKLSKGYSARAVVELKLSSNKRLTHGYTTQLDTYKKAEGTSAGYFVVLDNSSGTRQLKKLLKLEGAAKIAGEKHSPVIVIDARPKRSASKR